MRNLKFRKSYRNCTSCKTASARQTGDFSDSQNKRRLKEKKKAYTSVFLILKILLNAFSENLKKKLHYQLCYFHPCSLELSRHFPIMMNTGTQVDTSDTTTVLIKVETVFPLRERFFPLRQTMPQKLLSINPLSSF